MEEIESKVTYSKGLLTPNVIRHFSFTCFDNNYTIIIVGLSTCSRV